jgi:hypothetical protein
LAARWSRQAHEIGSARIKFRLSRPGEQSLARLSPEQVRKVIDEAKLAENPENFEAVLKKLWEPSQLHDRLWSPGEFHSIGLMTRENRDWGVRLFDGEWDLDYSVPNKQISVFRAGESRQSRLQIGDFRLQGSSENFVRLDHVLEPNNQIVFSIGSNRLVADWTTGFIYERSSRSSNGVSEIFQFAPTGYAGGIVFPKLKIELRYTSNELSRLELIYVDEAAFNQGAVGDTFKLAAKAGTNVFIFKPDPVARSQFIAVREDTTDVAALVRKRAEH